MKSIFEKLYQVEERYPKRGKIMRLVEALKSKTGALKVAEVARLLGVTTYL